MAYQFPSEEWLHALERVLNEDSRYAEIARNWEGDLLFAIDPEGGEEELARMYMDLWHGKCRGVEYISPNVLQTKDAKFTLTATLSRFKSILNNELDPLQAMATRKLKVRGNMAYLLRNVPVVLDFVRCASLVGIKE